MNGNHIKTNEELDSALLSIYPNPTNTVFSIRYNDAFIDNTKVAVYNMVGQKVYESNRTDNNHYDISNLATGAYLVKIGIGNQEFTKRIIKN
jgi:hypothetical protein